MLRETTPRPVQPECLPHENLWILGYGVRVNAVVRGVSYPPDLRRGGAQPAPVQDRWLVGLGLDGTSHMAMSIACKPGKDIMSRACPHCTPSAPRSSQLHHHLSICLLGLFGSSTFIPSLHSRTHSSQWFSVSMAPRSLLWSRFTSNRLVVPPLSRSSTRTFAARALTTASSLVLPS